MTSLNSFAKEILKKQQDKMLQRSVTETDKSGGINIVRNDKNLISFACNDYLGLSQNQSLKQAAKDAIDQSGVGSAASRLITGNHPYYTQLEQTLSSYLGTESSLVFGNGYMASLGVISSLLGKNDLVIADKHIHASLLDGVALCNATMKRYPHNDYEATQQILTKHRSSYRNCLIITETIFSMDGDLADTAKLWKLAKEHDAWLLTDHAHGMGVIDTPYLGESHLITGNFAKSCGVYGGYVAGSEDAIDLITCNARSLIYTTSLPPSVIASARKAIEILRTNDDLSNKLMQKVRLFDAKAQSPIIIIEMPDIETMYKKSAELERHGYFISCIRPPTAKTPRLRLSFSLLHKDEDIIKLKNLLGK
jgi:8-amino-7-oxononanoate synthase